MGEIKTTELVVFVVLFAAVSVLGFVAARWRRPDTMDHDVPRVFRTAVDG